MVSAPAGMPPQLWEKVRALLAAGATGRVELDVKDGKILAYKITEHGRCDGRAVSNCEQRN